MDQQESRGAGDVSLCFAPGKGSPDPRVVCPDIAAGKLLGGLAAYDDAVTERTADYLELYNSAGSLIAIGWFDRFGIERVAVDRALLEDAAKLEGVFIVLVEGDSV